MKRSIGVLTAALFVLGLVAGPAAAENKVAVFTGVAQVSKDPFGANCSPAVQRGGLGAPVVTGVKKGYYRLSTTMTTPNGVNSATLLVCGRLGPVLRGATNGGIGAACGMSKGHGGTGSITDTSGNKSYSISLTNVGWKATAGGTLPVTGDASWSGKETAKGAGRIVSIVQAQGGLGCIGKSPTTAVFEKNDNPKGTGAVEFNVVGAAAVLQGDLADLVPEDNDNGITCKDEGCPYGPKKS